MGHATLRFIVDARVKNLLLKRALVVTLATSEALSNIDVEFKYSGDYNSQSAVSSRGCQTSCALLPVTVRTCLTSPVTVPPTHSRWLSSATKQTSI